MTERLTEEKRAIKEAGLGRTIFFGEASFRRAPGVDVADFHAGHPHQGLG